MVVLGTLGGRNSEANGVSANGSVIVGAAQKADGQTRAFRWTQDDGMLDLGTLSGFQQSVAYGVSAGGNVVVGAAVDGEGRAGRAFRWNDIKGMQSVEEWLSDHGVNVGGGIRTKVAYGTNAGGNVVVGQLQNGKAFIARAGRNSKSNKPAGGGADGAAVW